MLYLINKFPTERSNRWFLHGVVVLLLTLPFGSVFAQSKPDSGSAIDRGSARGASVLKKKNRELSRQIEKMQSELDRAQSELTGLKDQIDTKSDDLAGAESLVRSSTREIENLERSLSEYQAQIDSLEADLRASQSQEESKDAKISLLEAELKSNQSQIGLLERSLERTQREMDLLRDEALTIESIEQRNVELEDRLQEKLDDNKRLQERNAELADALTNVNELNDSLEERIQQSASAQSNASNEASQFRELSEKKQAELDAAKKSLKELEAQIASKDDEIRSTEQKYNLSRAKVTEMRKKSEESESALKEIENIYSKVEQELQESKESLEKRSNEYALLQQKYAEQLKEKAETKTQYGKSNEDKKDTLDKLNTANAEIAALLESNSQAIIEKNKEIASLQQQISRAKNNDQATQAKSLEELKQLNEKFSQTEQQLAENEGLIQELNDQILAMESNSVLLDEYELLEAEAEESQLQNKRLEDSLNEALQANSSADELRKKLESQLVEYQHELTVKDQENNALIQKIVMLEATQQTSITSTESKANSKEDNVTTSGDNPVYSLGGGWGVEISDSGPSNYINYEQALEQISEMPAADECELFAEGFFATEGLESKLEINGFPVLSFWVKRKNEKLGLCRVTVSAAGEFRANVGRQRPARLDSAIKPILSTN